MCSVCGWSRALADEHAQHVRRVRQVAIAGAVADAVDRHRRHGTERRRIARDQQRAGRRHEFALNAGGIYRRPAEQLHGGRRRNRKVAVRRLHHAAADVQRRADDAIGTEPLHRKDGADDVDDRVERADLVQMNLLDRNLVDGRFGLAKTMKQLLARDACAAGDSAERSISALISARLRCG